ncbi:MAG: DUF2723 domain-containing protein [Methylotenera sp.]|nr:DUF2723 domain-containing protein [Flavobacterium sp.]
MRSKIIAGFLLIISVSALFLKTLPSTVQMGDTGELIRSAYMLEVAHPPGYPLYIWLMHAVLKYFEFGTVFWRASVASSFFSIFSCLLLFLTIRSKPLLGLLLGLTLATSRIFWKFSILPDVFSLHVFISSIIAYIYLDPKIKDYRVYLPFIFLLGLTHHLTIIFICPIIFHVCLINIKSIKMWLSSLLGLVTVFLFYSSMMIMHPENFNSWGSVTTINNVILHFLRNDYGTFQLIPTEEKGSTIDNLLYLASQGLNSFLPVLIIAFVILISRNRKKNIFSSTELIFSGSLLLYIFGFFPLANIQMAGFKIETLERFFIFVNVYFCFWAAIQLKCYSFNKSVERGIAVILCAGVFLNLYNFYSENDFSKNTIIADYASNLLNQSMTEKPEVLIENTDTRYGALQYQQSVLGIHPEVIIIHPKKFFFNWFGKKIESKGLVIDSKKILNTNNLAIEEDLILPNITKYNFLTSLDFQNSEKYKITILPLGRMLQAGSGLYIIPDNAVRVVYNSNYEDIFGDTIKYNHFREIWTAYGTYPFLKGLTELEFKNAYQAKLEFTKSLQIVPWYLPAQIKICGLRLFDSGETSEECKLKQQSIENNYFKYF